ncbi:hypothetical protein D8674_011958 [Pyrus ussuriensis x Pyrus communis]|uniref:Uncharacterized protein n=1 Tax=Pyrus ussuriensis x Pyrus communis TaxID=2448454 RepID=A0A5N5G4Y7_9ROSA|nr:hypothetical protein D8674_011958 [Pyrus ussuriensis x Pyrus communis]
MEEQDGPLVYQFTENENDPYSNSYNQWTEHPTMWDQIAKLEESTRLFMESTPKLQKINSIDNLNDSDSNLPTQPIANHQVLEECSAYQTLRWGKTNDTTMEESEIEEPLANDTCPITPGDLELVIT